MSNSTYGQATGATVDRTEPCRLGVPCRAISVDSGGAQRIAVYAPGHAAQRTSPPATLSRWDRAILVDASPFTMFATVRGEHCLTVTRRER